MSKQGLTFWDSPFQLEGKIMKIEECPKCANTGVDCKSYGEYACGACDCMYGRSEATFRKKVEATVRERLRLIYTPEIYNEVDDSTSYKQALEWVLREVLKVSVI